MARVRIVTEAMAWVVEVRQNGQVFRCFAPQHDHRQAITAAVKAMPWLDDKKPMRFKTMAVHILASSS